MKSTTTRFVFTSSKNKGVYNRVYERLRKRNYRRFSHPFPYQRYEHAEYVRGVRDALYAMQQYDLEEL